MVIAIAFFAASGLALLAVSRWSPLTPRPPISLTFALLTAGNLWGFAAVLARALRAYDRLSGHLGASIRALEADQPPPPDDVGPQQARDEQLFERAGRDAAAHPLVPWIALLVAAAAGVFYWLAAAQSRPGPAHMDSLIQGALALVTLLNVTGNFAIHGAIYRIVERQRARIRELEGRTTEGEQSND